MVTVQIPAKELKCLREHLMKAEEILNRLGFGLDGNSPTNIAVKKEPTNKQRIKNYDEVLSLGKKNSKPKHLQK
jgi:hypothetical protein